MVDYLIIARSGRALAASAKRGGYKVNVADQFTDDDTKSFSESVHLLQYHNDGFVEDEVLNHARKILSRYPNAKLVLGSGFESNPELIDKLNKIGTVLSNSKDSINAVKDPLRFFGMLKKNAISYPETLPGRPDVSKNYLIKKKAGIGGVHVNWADQVNFEAGSDYYFQEYVPGVVSSAVFFANGSQASIVGFNLQLQFGEFADMPFLYQGAISLEQEAVEHKAVIESIVNIITRETGLKGLCGLDYIVNESDEIVVLEVNPRPPATFELHEDQQPLFETHIACFDDKLSDRKKQDERGQVNNAYAILYAKENSLISDKVEWPSWVKDRPQSGHVIAKKSPVCTVHASENSLDKVKSILFNRLQQIETMIAATQNAA